MEQKQPHQAQRNDPRLAHGMSNAGEAAALSVGARLRRASKERIAAAAPAGADCGSARSSRSSNGSLGDVASGLTRLRRSSRDLAESASPAAANVIAMLRPGAMLKRAATHTDMRAQMPQNAKPASHAVRLRLQRVDFQTISAIDQVAQTFAARIFVIFDIPADAVTDTLLAGLNEEKGPFRSARQVSRGTVSVAIIVSRATASMPRP